MKNINDGEFEPKPNIKDRYSLESTGFSSVEEFKETLKLKEEYTEKMIKSFMDNGMDRSGAQLQTIRKMNGCG